MSHKKKPRHPILDAFAEYLSCKDKSKATVFSYTKQVRILLEYINKEPNDLTQEDLDNYKLYLKTKKNRKGVGIDRNTYIPISAAINHFMQFLDKPQYKFTTVPARSKPVIPLDVDEVSRLIQASKKGRARDYAIYCTLYYGALRISDALDLDLDNVDFERKKLRILDSKGGYNDEINLHPIALQAIQHYINSERNQYDKLNEKALFLSEKTGRRLERNQVWKMVKEYAVDAGITKKVNTHIFRHSCLTHMAANGATLPQLMNHSRHNDPKCVMKYIHLGQDKMEEIYARTVPDLFSGEPTGPSQALPEIVQKSTAPQSTDQLQRLLDMLENGKISEETFNRLLDRTDQKPQKKEEKNDDFISYIS